MSVAIGPGAMQLTVIPKERKREKKGKGKRGKREKDRHYLNTLRTIGRTETESRELVADTAPEKQALGAGRRTIQRVRLRI
jgi:hypothetical protein